MRFGPIRNVDQIGDRPRLRKEVIDSSRSEFRAAIRAARPQQPQLRPLLAQMPNQTAHVTVRHLEVENREVEGRFQREEGDGCIVRTGPDTDCARSPQ
jgi:hypothetical protein